MFPNDNTYVAPMVNFNQPLFTFEDENGTLSGAFLEPDESPVHPENADFGIEPLPSWIRGGGGESGNLNDPVVSNPNNANSFAAYEANIAGKTITYGSIATGVSSQVKYSKYYGSWMGGNYKFNSTSWPGNQYTGPRVLAKTTGNILSTTGVVLGVLNYGFIKESYNSGAMCDYEYNIEMASNTISTFGGI